MPKNDVFARLSGTETISSAKMKERPKKEVSSRDALYDKVKSGKSKVSFHSSRPANGESVWDRLSKADTCSSSSRKKTTK